MEQLVRSWPKTQNQGLGSGGEQTKCAVSSQNLEGGGTRVGRPIRIAAQDGPHPVHTDVRPSTRGSHRTGCPQRGKDASVIAKTKFQTVSNDRKEISMETPQTND